MSGYKRNIMITGGAGFIGSHVVRLFVDKYPEYRIVNLDKLTYAGNLANLKDVEDKPNYVFEKADICDFGKMQEIIRKYEIDGVIHLAAESHVDRSIRDPFTFARTNVMGTLSLLQAAKVCWEEDLKGYDGKLFYHISTDEVYGALQFDGKLFTEETHYQPHSPYSASKASSDHFVRAFHDTYGMPVVVTNCSNNYGPYQFPEKLIPLFINNIRHKKPLPVYGKGENVRDWLYVEDHCKAIDLVLHKGRAGEVYNVGGHNEKTNLEIVKLTIRTIRQLMTDQPIYRNVLKKRIIGPDGEISIDWINDDLITFVKDRLGHDQRYAIDPSKIQQELGWSPETPFESGIVKTIRWYLEHQSWVESIIDGNYIHYYEQMYTGREIK